MRYALCTVTGKQLKAIRREMKITQRALAERLKVTASSVARMEQGVMIVTPPMELLIQYVARDAGVDPANGHTGGRAVTGKAAHGGKAADPIRKDRRRQGSQKVPPRGR